MKVIYIVVLFLYTIIGIVYLSRAEVSYRVVKVRPELVEERSLTQDEVAALDRAYIIRRTISTIFICCSIVIALFSFILLRYNLFTPVLLLKIVMWVSFLSALVLIIANGVHFIPGPPIR